MQTPGQDLFRAILRLSKSTIKPNFSDMGVNLSWDLQNLELKGDFTIPLQTAIDSQSGEYIVTAQDFASEPPATP